MLRQRCAICFYRIIIMQTASLMSVAKLIGGGCFCNQDIGVGSGELFRCRIRFERKELERCAHDAAVYGGIQMLIKFCQCLMPAFPASVFARLLVQIL